ncbi:MAG TPA: hypothetical protein VGN37_00445 [Actinocatenispora sp.]
MNVRVAGVVVAGLAALTLVGCGPDKTAAPSGSTGPSAAASASTSPGSASPSPSGSAAPTPGRTTTVTPVPSITLDVTGGIAGRHDTVTVTPTGRWRATDGKLGVTRQGTLTSAQRTELVRLITGPELAKEARVKQPKIACNDGMSYRLTVGSLVLTRSDCGGSSHTPTFDAVVKLVTQASAK